MKLHISLIALMSVMVAISQPVKAMEDEERQRNFAPPLKFTPDIPDSEYKRVLRLNKASTDPELHYLVGKAFEFGFVPGCNMNMKKACKFYKKAADQGYQKASKGLIRAQDKLDIIGGKPKTFSGWSMHTELQSYSQGSGKIRSHLMFQEAISEAHRMCSWNLGPTLRTEDVDKTPELQTNLGPTLNEVD